MNTNFKVKLLGEALDFIDSLGEKERTKIIYNMNKASSFSNKNLFKKLSGNIWEFRTLYNQNYYRFFAFWDTRDSLNSLVISTHGIIKKTSKIQQRDIDKAEELRRLYFEVEI